MPRRGPESDPGGVQRAAVVASAPMPRLRHVQDAPDAELSLPGKPDRLRNPTYQPQPPHMPEGRVGSAMTLLLQILAGLLLALGSGLIWLAVLRMDAEEWEEDRVSEDWLRRME